MWTEFWIWAFKTIFWCYIGYGFVMFLKRDQDVTTND